MVLVIITKVGQRIISFAQGEFYHAYNRGTDKRVIFQDEIDYERFRELLFLCNSNYSINVRDIKKVNSSIFDFDRGETLVSIGAYCLMPNHFHLLITPTSEEGLSIFMGKLGTSYSMFFNKKYERSGNLFQGKFKASSADSDEYLKYLYSYIHLNPLKLIDPTWREKGIKDSVLAYEYISQYPHSSVSDWLGSQRRENAILDMKAFPDYFSNQTNKKRELLEWINFNPIF